MVHVAAAHLGAPDHPQGGSLMHTRSKFPIPLLLSLLLSACGGGISGTYEGGMGTIKFESGKAYATLMQVTREMDYRTEGDKVVLRSPEGDLVLTRHADGSLDTPWGSMKKSE